MKTNVTITAVFTVLAFISLFAFAGCQNKSDQPINFDKLDRITEIVDMASSVATRELVKREPDATTAILIAADVIDGVIAGDHFDPIVVKLTIAQTLEAKGMGQYNDIVEVALSLILEQYANFYIANFREDIDRVPAIQGVLAAIRDGIRSGASGPNVGSPQNPSGSLRTVEDILDELPDDLSI